MAGSSEEEDEDMEDNEETLTGKKRKRRESGSPSNRRMAWSAESDFRMASYLVFMAQNEAREARAKGRPRVFRCKTCGRSFDTFQALGGHRTSHGKKLKEETSDVGPLRTPPANDVEPLRTPPSNDVAPLRTPPSNDVAPLRTPPSKERKAGRLHLCNLCGAGYASGQALGGHMRRHRGLLQSHESIDLELRLRPPQ